MNSPSSQDTLQVAVPNDDTVSKAEGSDLPYDFGYSIQVETIFIRRRQIGVENSYQLALKLVSRSILGSEEGDGGVLARPETC